MDQKKSPNRRSKRQSKLAEDNFWDCSVCTYRNTAEAFKCLMCDVRKGTSTRKPRINTQLVAQQVAQQYNQLLPKVKKEGQVMAKPEFGIGVAMGNSLPGIPHAIPVISSSGGGGGGGVGVGVVVGGGGVGGGGGGGAAANTGGGTGGGGGSTITKSEKKHSSHGESKTTSRKVRPKLKNVDRSSAEHKAVTVNNVTVIITEFQPKRHQSSSSSSEHNHSLSSGSGSGSHGHTNSHHHHHNTLTNGCVENGIHSDSTNLSNDSHSDGRSS